MSEGNVVELRPGVSSEEPVTQPAGDLVESNDPTFTKAIKAFLPECWQIAVERGGQYGDTWALENRINTYKTFVLKLPIRDELMPRWLRLLDAASLLDTKETRHLTGYRRDTVVDSINYLAAFGYLTEDYLAELAKLQEPQS